MMVIKIIGKKFVTQKESIFAVVKIMYRAGNYWPIKKSLSELMEGLVTSVKY
jgi:hypothetical protein